MAAADGTVHTRVVSCEEPAARNCGGAARGRMHIIEIWSDALTHKGMELAQLEACPVEAAKGLQRELHLRHELRVLGRAAARAAAAAAGGNTAAAAAATAAAAAAATASAAAAGGGRCGERQRQILRPEPEAGAAEPFVSCRRRGGARPLRKGTTGEHMAHGIEQPPLQLRHKRGDVRGKGGECSRHGR